MDFLHKAGTIQCVGITLGIIAVLILFTVLIRSGWKGSS